MPYYSFTSTTACWRECQQESGTYAGNVGDTRVVPIDRERQGILWNEVDSESIAVLGRASRGQLVKFDILGVLVLECAGDLTPSARLVAIEKS